MTQKEAVKPVKVIVEKTVPMVEMLERACVFADQISNEGERNIYLKNMEYVTKSAMMRKPLSYTPAEVLPAVIFYLANGDPLGKALSTIPIGSTQFYRMCDRYPEMAAGYALGRQLFISYWQQQQADALRDRDGGFNFYSFYSMMQRSCGTKGGYVAPNDTIIQIPALREAKNAKERNAAVLDYIATNGIGVKALTQLTSALTNLSQLEELETLTDDMAKLKDQLGVHPKTGTWSG